MQVCIDSLALNIGSGFSGCHLKVVRDVSAWHKAVCLRKSKQWSTNVSSVPDDDTVPDLGTYQDETAYAGLQPRSCQRDNNPGGSIPVTFSTPSRQCLLFIEPRQILTMQ